MAMMRCRDVAAHFRRAEFDLKFGVERETRLLLEGAAEEAKAFIGHELEEWQPLAPSTVAEKQRLGYTGQISETDPLLRTGRLRDSLRAEAESTSAGATGIVGSDDPVAVWQEFGTPHIPPRPFIGPTGISIVARAHVAFGEMAVRALTPGGRP
jgi:phage gpG-like protein